MTKVAFITTFCPHHRLKTFEMLGCCYNLFFYFFSPGDEAYWQEQHGVQRGNFGHEYLPGIRIGKTRFVPALLNRLWTQQYDVYIKCINGRFALPLTYLIARLKRKPLILWTGLWMRVHTPAHRLFFPITRYIYRHVNAIVVYGDHVKRYLIQEGVPAEKIFTAHHATDNNTYNRQVAEREKAALRQKLDIAIEQKILLYLGRLEPGKGLPHLLEAFASLVREDVTLILAGTGSESTKLKQLTQSLGISKQVRFPGYVPTDQTVPFYALAWVYILPSVTTPTFKEPWGLVVNEAFNQGVPVVATDAVGAAAGGLIQDGVNGFIVPEKNSNALRQALTRLLDDSTLHNRLSQAARQTIAKWDNDRMISGFRQAIAYVTSR